MKEKTIICEFCKDPLCEAEIEQFRIDGLKRCWNWQKEVEE